MFKMHSITPEKNTFDNKKVVTKMDIVNKGIQFSWQLTWGNILQEIIDSDHFFGISIQRPLSYNLKNAGLWRHSTVS